MNRGYNNLKQLEDATVQAINELETAIITEGNTASHQLGEAKTMLLSAIKSAVDEELSGRVRGDGENAEDITAVRHRLSDFMRRGFWSRLNWLLTGR